MKRRPRQAASPCHLVQQAREHRTVASGLLAHAGAVDQVRLLEGGEWMQLEPAAREVLEQDLAALEGHAIARRREGQRAPVLPVARPSGGTPPASARRSAGRAGPAAPTPAITYVSCARRAPRRRRSSSPRGEVFVPPAACTRAARSSPCAGRPGAPASSRGARSPWRRPRRWRSTCVRPGGTQVARRAARDHWVVAPDGMVAVHHGHRRGLGLGPAQCCREHRQDHDSASYPHPFSNVGTCGELR